MELTGGYVQSSDTVFHVFFLYKAMLTSEIQLKMKQSGDYFDIERANSWSYSTHCVSIMNSSWSVTYCIWPSSENFSGNGEMARIVKTYFMSIPRSHSEPH